MRRKPGQSLQEFYDAICSAAEAADIAAPEKDKLMYTAFVHGLRNNRHMHQWVSQRETTGDIASALELAEAYEDEYGWQSVPRTSHVTVNARSIAPRRNRPAIRSPDVCQTPARSVSNGNSMSLGVQMNSGFRKLQKQINTQFSGLSSRLRAVETYQQNQMYHWQPRPVEWQSPRRSFDSACRHYDYPGKVCYPADQHRRCNRRPAGPRMYQPRRNDGWRTSRNFRRYDSNE